MNEFEFLLLDRLQKIRSINEQYDLEKNAYVSFSGGKDSTVLHYLIDEALPNNKIPRLFLNTGIEYKMIVQFVKRCAENDSRIYIYNSRVNIIEMLKKKGYPFKSKEHSQKVYGYKNGWRNESTLQYFGMLPNGYNICPKKLLCQIEANYPLKISDSCCHELKKKPAEKWAKENNKTIRLTGMRKEEGGERTTLNCIVLKDNSLVKFHPLAVVNEKWIDEYVHERNIKLCELYYPPYNFKRTGCKGCPFSLGLENGLLIMENLLPAERKQCEMIWKPVYDEYRRLNYRLHSYPLLDE